MTQWPKMSVQHARSLSLLLSLYPLVHSLAAKQSTRDSSSVISIASCSSPTKLVYFYISFLPSTVSGIMFLMGVYDGAWWLLCYVWTRRHFFEFFSRGYMQTGRPAKESETNRADMREREREKRQRIDNQCRRNTAAIWHLWGPFRRL